MKKLGSPVNFSPYLPAPSGKDLDKFNNAYDEFCSDADGWEDKDWDTFGKALHDLEIITVLDAAQQRVRQKKKPELNKKIKGKLENLLSKSGVNVSYWTLPGKEMDKHLIQFAKEMDKYLIQSSKEMDKHLIQSNGYQYDSSEDDTDSSENLRVTAPERSDGQRPHSLFRKRIHSEFVFLTQVSTNTRTSSWKRRRVTSYSTF
jgi:hypothetical protein